MKAIALVCLLLMVASVASAEKLGERFCEACLNVDATLSPTVAFQTVSGNTTGQPNGEYTYSFCALGGNTYTFTFCSNGGSAGYDTALSIQGPNVCGAFLMCNDDTCGLQSELVWVCPADGTYLVVVDGFSSNVGPYTMAYAGAPCVTPTESTSWGTVKSLYN